MEFGVLTRTRSGLRRPAPLTVDLLLCAALLAFTFPAVRDRDIGRVTTLGTALLPAVVLPILLRHRRPVAAAAAFAAGCVISGIPTFDQFRVGAAIPAAMLLTYSLGRRTELRPALAGLALVLCGLAVIGPTDAALNDSSDGGGTVGLLIFTVPLSSGIWAAGRLIRSRERVAGQLAEWSAQLEVQRERTATLAVEIERTRLASHVDTAVRTRLQSMIALTREEGPGPATFAAIESRGRETLNDLRELLGVLRSDEPGERSPRPTLAQLDGLLAEARAAGRPVSLEVAGDPRPLPMGLELAAYRIVQHALAAIGGDAMQPATVRLHYGVDALGLEVRGAPRGGSVAAHGGSFSSDAPPLGAHVLRARLPEVATLA